MAFKPVHIITNDDLFYAKLIDSGLQYEQGCEDYTEDEGLHYHYHVHWQVTDNYTLSPTRPGAVGIWRRTGGCEACKNKQHNYRCDLCGIYYKFIWLQSAEHHHNLHNYIQAKIDADPRVNVEWFPEESEAESDEEGA